MTRGLRDPNPVSSRSGGSVFANSMITVTLKNVTTGNMRIYYVYVNMCILYL